MDNGPVRPDEWEYYLPLIGDTMFELGGKFNKSVGKSYKSHFEALGYRHISVDWDGQYGAINRDLRKPLWDEFGQFDMVCNIGTTEHVSKQFMVWKNIHQLTKKGGILVSVTPYHDGKSWWWHGEWYPTEEFFESFAELNGWEIERIGTDLPEPHKNLYVRLKKFDEREFVMPDLSLIVENKRRPR